MLVPKATPGALQFLFKRAEEKSLQPQNLTPTLLLNNNCSCSTKLSVMKESGMVTARLDGAALVAAVASASQTSGDWTFVQDIIVMRWEIFFEGVQTDVGWPTGVNSGIQKKEGKTKYLLQTPPENSSKSMESIGHCAVTWAEVPKGSTRTSRTFPSITQPTLYNYYTQNRIIISRPLPAGMTPIRKRGLAGWWRNDCSMPSSALTRSSIPFSTSENVPSPPTHTTLGK